MLCYRCQTDFCWCCMRKLDDHNKWYLICPELTFSYCINLILTLLFIIFLPVILLVVPLIGILVSTLIFLPFDCPLWSDVSCCCKAVIWLLCLILVMPIAVAIGMAITVVVAAIAIIPLYFLSLSFLVRLIYIGCKTKL